MATLHEYFMRDGSNDLTYKESWTVQSTYGESIGRLTIRLHFAFQANAKYISFFVDDFADKFYPEMFIINKISEIVEWTTNKSKISFGYQFEMRDAEDLVFTSQIYMYSNRIYSQEKLSHLVNEYAKVGCRLIVRGAHYMNERNRMEKPLAFISHDSRDKISIAEPLAVQLSKWSCPVWYDQFSLRVGDSLRESIESGLRECQKCVLVLSPNFINNVGWAKREYDSIFTREIVENKKVILPVWHDVSTQQIFNFSPILADRVAAKWSLGVEEVATQLLSAINAS